MRKILALGVAFAALSVATPTMAYIDTTGVARDTTSDTRNLVPRAADTIRTLLVAQGNPTDPKCPKNYILEDGECRPEEPGEAPAL
jgi:phage-related baseplate assembly protein